MITSLKLAGLCALLGLAGCSLSRGAPLPQQYVLGEDTPPGAGAAAGGQTGMTVGIRRLNMAAYLATPGVLVRRGGQEITSSAFHLWAEPLDAGISRAVAGYLRGSGQFNVDVAPWPVRAEHDYLLQLDVLRFEGMAPADSTALGEVQAVISWTILRSGNEAILERGRTEHRSPSWTVGDYSALVLMLNDGLQALAEDLDAALRRVASAPSELSSVP